MEKRVALITGSATGIGKAIARQLAKAGHHIVINYVHSEKQAQETAQELEQKYAIQTQVIKADVSQEGEVVCMIEQIKEQFGRLDILVHNAGPFIFETKSLRDYTIEEWQQMIDGNLSSYFYLLKEALPLMAQHHWGRVVVIGFEKAGQAPAWRYRSAFAAAKSGAASLTRTLALEEAENGITVNMVCPADIKGEDKERMIIEATKNTMEPIGRVGVGEDIARTIAFLCEEDSSYVTGSIIEVLGGKEVLAKRNDKRN